MNPTAGEFWPETTSHILVVDDDPTVLDLEATVLKRAGYRVDTASDGTTAWHALLTHAYDLLVTDYLMPGVSGLALVRQLRVANHHLPVVLVSGTLHSLDLARLHVDPWTRIEAFVNKPFMVVDLLAAVRGALSLAPSGRAGDQLTPA